MGWRRWERAKFRSRLAFDHKPWSTFGDADKIAPYNPLRRVPTLVLNDGEALIESDHPSAVAFYQRSGFRAFRRQIEIADDPRIDGTAPRTAAKHVPIVE